MRAAAMIPLALLSCGWLDGRPAPVGDAEARAVDLSALPFAELVVPPDNRPDHAAPPDRIPLDGTWDGAGGASGGRRSWSTEVPIRPRGLFFHRPTAGMSLHAPDGTIVPYERDGSRVARPGAGWSFDREELTITLPEADGTPKGYTLAWGLATKREAALNQAFSGLPPERFVWTTIQDDQDSRRGLLLPAPGVASWDVAVPPGGELTFVPGLVEPEVRQGGASDGAVLTVEVEVDGAAEVLWTGRLAIRSFHPQRVDLSGYAGRTVRLRFRTDPGDQALYDYAFVAEPVVASREDDPTRILMVFVDTLRPDHLSLYGYERDTSAAIDPLAATSVVFTQARTVAPWTLPSAQSIVTGRYPERYATSDTVQELLRRRGYATAFFAGNVYLTANFEMNRDWELHRTGGMWPLAEETTDQALAWLAEHDGRDVLLQVHYMSAHLPYVEPPSYRRRYAGDPPPGLEGEFHLSQVRAAKPQDDPEKQQYVRDRYDNNVRYATDQVARLVAELDDNDVFLLYSDHGEEFWEHGGFEHGHSLFEELVHVPLVIRAPGVVARKTDAPVSLLDLTPTILELAGEPVPQGLDGRSLVPLLRGEPGAEEAFAGRTVALGHPLYGQEKWGVVHDREKWITHEGREALFDLDADPAEKSNRLLEDPLDRGAPYRALLAEELGREVAVGYRLTPTQWKGTGAIPGIWALCTVPGGFEHAWKGDDPLQNSDATVATFDDPERARRLLTLYQITGHEIGPDDGAVEVCWHPGRFGAREVYLVPRGPLADAGRAMVCSGYMGDAKDGKRGTMRIPPHREPGLGAIRTPPNRLLWDQRQLLWQWGIGPVPDATTATLAGADAELRLALVELGYTDPGADPTLSDQEPPEGVCTPPAAQLRPMTPEALTP